MRAGLLVLLFTGGLAACGGGGEDFSGECSVAGLNVTTTLGSCDAALEEGRRLVVEHGLALADAPKSGIDAVLSAHCMDWDDLDAQAQRLQNALRTEVCV